MGIVYILDNLALGSLADTAELPPGITALLNVAEEIDVNFTDRLYRKIPITHFSPIPPDKMRQAVDWIKENIARHKILVLCKAGIGRSSSVVIGYLVIEKGFGFGQAVEFVAQRKPDISIVTNLINTIKEASKQTA